MISLFATGDFVRARIKDAGMYYGIGVEVLIMGIAIFDAGEGGHQEMAIVNGAKGQIEFVNLGDLVSDFIYDVEKDMFVDAHAQEPEDVGEDDVASVQ